MCLFLFSLLRLLVSFVFVVVVCGRVCCRRLLLLCLLMLLLLLFLSVSVDVVVFVVVVLVCVVLNVVV